MLTWLLYLVIGLTATWAVYLIYMQLATRAVEGRDADPLFETIPDLKRTDRRALVYCYSPQCGPCRFMSPVVEALQREDRPIFALNVAEHPDLAREIGVRASPTVLVVHHGRIERSLLGARDRDRLLQLLE
jgi:thioredoxin 1